MEQRRKSLPNVARFLVLPRCSLVVLCLCTAVAATCLVGTSCAADELSDRMTFWRAQAFQCRGAFPSKNDTGDLEGCGDGDMTLFNGLLCLSGEQIGCDAVKESQGGDGRWWRSPRRVGWEYPKYDVSFSPDQALGVLSYVLSSKNGTAFDSWLKWITAHRGKLTSAQIKEVSKDVIAKLNWSDAQINAAVTILASALPPRLSYCSDDYDARCTLRPGDCAIIKDVATALGRTTDICGNYLLFNQIQVLFNSVGLSVPSALSVASSFFNDENYPLHLAAVQVFLLQKAGEGDDPLVLTAAHKVANREPKNAFFAFLATGSTTSDAHDLLLSECPPPKAPSSARIQWAWERPDSEKAWLQSMYWDCIFVGKLISP